MVRAEGATFATIASNSATVEEIANEWGRSPDAVYRDIRKGHIPAGVAIRLGRSVRINRLRLAEWLEAGGTMRSTAA